MLRQEAGIGPSRSDIHEADVPGSYHRKSKGGSEDLAAAFALCAIKRENVHLYPIIRHAWACDIARPNVPRSSLALGFSAIECRHDLVGHARLLSAVARREVKRLDPACCARFSNNVSM